MNFRTSPSEIRRRHLLLDLSAHGAPVEKQRMPLISARLAAAYAGKTAKTLARDVNALLADGLIERVESGYRARTEIILAFLPGRHEASATDRD